MTDYSEWTIHCEGEDYVLSGPGRSTYLPKDFTLQDVLDMIEWPKLSKSNQNV